MSFFGLARTRRHWFRPPREIHSSFQSPAVSLGFDGFLKNILDSEWKWKVAPEPYFHLVKNIVFSPVGFKGNLSLLEIYIFPEDGEANGALGKSLVWLGSVDRGA